MTEVKNVLVARHKSCVVLSSVDFESSSLETIHRFPQNDLKDALFMQNGNLLIATRNEVKLFSGTTNAVQKELQVGVTHIQFSPKETYFSIFCEVQNQVGADNPNLHIFQADTFEKVAHFGQKNRELWCPQWSDDESICCLFLNYKIVFFSVPAFEQISYQQASNKTKSFAISPGKQVSLATFAVGNNNTPSLFSISALKDLTNPVSQLAILNIDTAVLKWNKTDNALIAIAHNTRTTQQSYYGETRVCFLDTKGSITCTVQPKNATSPSAFDAEWHPDGNWFCVIFDRVKAALFNLKCEQIQNLVNNRAARNGIYFNPFGNLFALTGSGNMTGNFEMWRKVDSSYKMICHKSVPYATMFSWSPNGLYFLTATTFPRLREENGFSIYDVAGNALVTLKCTENDLCDVKWKPFPCQSPSEFDISRIIVASKQEKSQEANDTQPKRYIPPHMRNKVNNNSNTDGNNKVTVKKYLPPGLTEEDLAKPPPTIGFKKKKRKGKKKNEPQDLNEGDNQAA